MMAGQLLDYVEAERRQQDGFQPDRTGRGPAQLPRFMWPTHGHDVNAGGATYTREPRSAQLRFEKVDPLQLAAAANMPNAANAALDAGGDGSRWQMRVDLPVDALTKVQNRIKALEGSLQLHGADQISDWDGTADDAVRRVRLAWRDHKNRPTAATAQALEHWSRLLVSHPDQIARERAEAEAWEARHAAEARESLAALRAIVPVRCARDGLARVRDARAEMAHLPRRLMLRIFRKSILCFVWMDAAQIAALPFDELDTKYWHHGLDLRERLAVWSGFTL